MQTMSKKKILCMNMALFALLFLLVFAVLSVEELKPMWGAGTHQRSPGLIYVALSFMNFLPNALSA